VRQAVTVAEDVSGMPALCRPVAEGGTGFDYRLAMGLPDAWVRLVSGQRDEHWSMAGIARALTDRRNAERTVAYVESHDQSLVGDTTLGAALYTPFTYTLTLFPDPGCALGQRAGSIERS